MVSALACFGVALCASIYALCKGRTAWHWFALGLAVFATIWVLSLIGLYLSNVEMVFSSEDRVLAAFAGAVTCSVIFIILLAVPGRPKKKRHRDEEEVPRVSA